MRLAKLPVGEFANFFPEGWTFEQGDYFQISTLIEHGDENRHVLPQYLEGEPNFDISIFLGNEKRFPRELFRLIAVSKTPEGKYVIGHLGVGDETSPEIAFLVRMMKTYGEEMLNKPLEYRQFEIDNE